MLHPAATETSEMDKPDGIDEELWEQILENEEIISLYLEGEKTVPEMEDIATTRTRPMLFVAQWKRAVEIAVMTIKKIPWDDIDRNKRPEISACFKRLKADLEYLDRNWPN
jgi:hypothetical protein